MGEKKLMKSILKVYQLHPVPTHMPKNLRTFQVAMLHRKMWIFLKSNQPAISDQGQAAQEIVDHEPPQNLAACLRLKMMQLEDDPFRSFPFGARLGPIFSGELLHFRGVFTSKVRIIFLRSMELPL